MGWPDQWTNVSDEQGKAVADSPRYKACGNGVASPVVHWIGLRLAAAIDALDAERARSLPCE
jgi:DNA (cytosine-5)-methyltransferase 1